METVQKLSNLYTAITAVKSELSTMENEYYSIIDNIVRYERTQEQKEIIQKYMRLQNALCILENI